MLRLSPHFIPAVCLLCTSLCHAQGAAPAENTPQPLLSAEPQALSWTFMVAPYVHHWTQSPEHRHAYIFTLEKHQDEQRLIGLALFRNSFGQPSAYAYGAYHWHGFLGEPRLTAKVSAGIIYGYTGKYADKVPLNWNGFSPGLIPSVGYKITQQDALHIMVLGAAGLALGYSHSF